AADALRELRGECLIAPVVEADGREGRVCVVAEEAFMPRAAQHALVIGAVVAGRHPPLLRLRVPRERQLIELAIRRLVEIGAGVVPRAEDPVDRLLEDARAARAAEDQA